MDLNACIMKLMKPKNYYLMITDQAELIGFSLYELLKYRATPSLFSYLAIIF